MVTMTHPELPDQPIEVFESAVPIHRQSGWRTADETVPAAETVPQTAPRARGEAPAPTTTAKE